MIIRNAVASVLAVLLVATSPLGMAIAQATEPGTDAAAKAPPAPSARAAEEADRARIAGAFKYVGSDAERAALNAAIERSIDGFSFFTKGAARSKLQEATAPKAWLRLSFVGDNIVVATPGALPTVSPDNGATVTVRGEDGTRAKVAQRLVGRRLVQHVVMDGATSQAEYVLGADDKTLTIRVRLKSDKLAAPVDYTLTYRR